MPNFWTITTQKIAEAFSGPRTKDVEFDEKVQEMLLVEKSVIGLKNIFLNFTNYTSGIKSFCRDFNISNKIIYDKSTSYGALGIDVTECHSQIEKFYEEFISQIKDLNIATNQWNNMFLEAKNAIEKREESRKTYDHYDEKMEKLYRSRQSKIKNNISENPKDYELVLRNEQKFKKATEDYIALSETAFECINNALNSRYELINPIVSKFIEYENKFYQSIFNSFRTLENIDYKFKLANKKYVKSENTYDPYKFIRGGDVIRTERENEKGKQETKPRSKSTMNDRNHGNSTNRTKEVNEFDQIENKFSYDRKNSIYNVKPNVQEIQQQNETEMAENINNPYAQINLNGNVSFAKNKYQQQTLSKRSNTSNTIVLNNNNNNHNNNFDFNNHQNNQMNNQFDFLRNSTNNNMTNRNMNQVNNQQQTFNFNQNNNSNYNQAMNYNQNQMNNNNNMNNFNFGLIDLTNTNNLQQNINNANNAINFYQNNQSQIHTFGNQAINMNNNLNNLGIATGIPATNFNFPKASNQNNNNKNDDIFKDFFK